jgi:hypothetical protein
VFYAKQRCMYARHIRGWNELRGFCYTPAAHRHKIGFDFDVSPPPARARARRAAKGKVPCARGIMSVMAWFRQLSSLARPGVTCYVRSTQREPAP